MQIKLKLLSVNETFTDEIPVRYIPRTQTDKGNFCDITNHALTEIELKLIESLVKFNALIRPNLADPLQSKCING